MMIRVENIRSCFLGLAIGDALGVPFEFHPRSYFTDRPVREMLGWGTWNQPPGTWSDDSSLTFCLAESLVNGYNPEDIGRKMAAWLTEGYWGAHHKVFDVGGTTRFSLLRIKGGEDPIFAGAYDEESNGNGSLMRIAPAALYFLNDTEDVFYQRIREISSMTHAHFRSVFSCFLFSKLLIELGRGGDKFATFYKAMTDVKKFAEKNNFNSTELKLFDRMLNGTIAQSTPQMISGSGYVVHTLHAAVWCLLTTDSYRDAVLKAVNLGDDTDTTACVTGALAGFYYGEDSIPSAWKDQLVRQDDIIILAEKFTDSVKNRILQG